MPRAAGAQETMEGLLPKLPKLKARAVSAKGLYVTDPSCRAWRGAQGGDRRPPILARPPPVSQAHLSPLEQEYAVSPNSPLLSTTVQNNAWVCGERRAGAGRAAQRAARAALQTAVAAGGPDWRAPGCGPMLGAGQPPAAGSTAQGGLPWPAAASTARVASRAAAPAHCAPTRRPISRQLAPPAAAPYPRSRRRSPPGDNGRGQLGVSNSQAVPVPQAIQTVGRWAAVAISDNHSAGLTGEGHLYTWGANSRGQLGHGDKCPGAIDAPVQVASLGDADVK